MEAIIIKFIEQLASPTLMVCLFIIGVLAYVLVKIIASQSKKDVLLADLTKEIEKANTTNASLTEAMRIFFDRLKEAGR